MALKQTCFRNKHFFTVEQCLYFTKLHNLHLRINESGDKREPCWVTTILTEIQKTQQACKIRLLKSNSMWLYSKALWKFHSLLHFYPCPALPYHSRFYFMFNTTVLLFLIISSFCQSTKHTYMVTRCKTAPQIFVDC